VTPEVNPNGALDNIAGIINAEGNVLGMMPHPERCAEAVLGNDDGKLIFLSMLESLKGKQEATEDVGGVTAGPAAGQPARPRTPPGVGGEGWPVSLLCSRNARPQKALVGRAQLETNRATL